MANRNRPNIPKFGEWKDGGSSMPYTMVFDNARMKKTDPSFNPNDPSQFQSLAQDQKPPAPPKPNATPPRPMKAGMGERREERRYPPNTPPQAHGRPREEELVPKFGAWNDPNAKAGQDFTVQFQRVGDQRNRDKNPGATPPPTYANANPIYQNQNQSPYGYGRAPHKSSRHSHKCVIL